MRSICPELSPRLADTLAALRAAGVEPTDAQIVWLGRLRDRCDSPCVESMVANLGAPFEFGGLLFWPLHMRAVNWFLRAVEICSDDLAPYVYMYAHLFSAPGDRALDMAQDANKIEADVRQWRGEFPLHERNEAEFIRLLRVIDGYSEDSISVDKAEEHVNDLTGVASLCRMFAGTTPEYWMTGISRAEISALCDNAESEKWASSKRRTNALNNYLSAVRYIKAGINGNE